MRLLSAMGYTRVRHYRGGLAEWRELGYPLEGARPPADRSPVRKASPAKRPHPVARLFGRLASLSFGSLLWLWIAVVGACGVAYWLATLGGGVALAEKGLPVGADLNGFLTALYFSAATATTVGYGDVAPVGWVRGVAVGEAAAGLLLFGIVVSKLVSHHQEQLTEEIHRTTFETRLGRVRTNLHLVLTELQGLARLCEDPAALEGPLLARVESAARVFVGELYAVHDLLYRPQEAPDEQILEGILASVAAGLEELHRLLGCLDRRAESATRVRASIAGLGRIARDICADCVPRSYAPRLRGLMDQVQELAGQLSVS